MTMIERKTNPVPKFGTSARPVASIAGWNGARNTLDAPLLSSDFANKPDWKIHSKIAA